ncbi:hypothetical protein DUE52_24260 [Larkinella punicea]|uniref:Beta-lactamase-related domain-containing protein n=1 Tax=Larkinella punicea TaxID=2315727 RepID=A0A368JGY7_9BACT|nr:hypothetical protein DUE52_24260 [Larkinella punicea]
MLLSSTRFGQLLIEGKIINRSTKAPIPYANIGIANSNEGDSFSSSSHLLIYPDDNLVIAFLANSQDGAAFDLQRIGELFYKK